MKQFENTIIKLRRGNSTRWEAVAATFIPNEGEPCLELDKKRIKIGDGVTTYANLPYWFDVPATDIESIIAALELGTVSKLDAGHGAGHVPVLNSEGKIDIEDLPAIALMEVFEVDSEEAMNALVVQNGDWAIRTDNNTMFINVKGKWIPFIVTPNILSVNGKTGVVVLNTDDIAEGTTNKFFTEERAQAVIKKASVTDLVDGVNVVKKSDLVNYVSTTDTIVIDGGSPDNA